jgi:hypothetical protein
MARYRKKPVVVDAWQFDGSLASAEELSSLDYNVTFLRGNSDDDLRVLVFTPEGLMTVSQGDWVIKGVKGEFYPCKPDIFEATYERVPEVVIALDYVKQDPAIPEDGPDVCPKCSGRLKVGYGMAGGGMGVYSYCPEHGILSKVQTD